MSNNLVLALSGASYSGKTTKMKELKAIYKDRLLLSDEVIRTTKINIADVRADSKKYLNFELDVIKAKIENDSNLYQKSLKNNSILLIDRSIFDSMTYFYMYLKPSDLDDESLENFSIFDEYLYKEAIPFYNEILDGILLFSPLKIDENKIKLDQYRQINLKYLQSVEYNMIKTLTNACFKKKIQNVNAISWKLKNEDLFSFNWK